LDLPVSGESLLRRLLDKGYVGLSALNLGIVADLQSLAVIAIDGQPSCPFFSTGLPLRGVLFASGIIAELLRQAVPLALRHEVMGRAVDMKKTNLDTRIAYWMRRCNSAIVKSLLISSCALFLCRHVSGFNVRPLCR